MRKSKHALARQWNDIMTAYRRKHRRWVMENMPRMPKDQWDQYTRWVADFGAHTLTETGKHARKVRRQLKAAKDASRLEPNHYANPPPWVAAPLGVLPSRQHVTGHWVDEKMIDALIDLESAKPWPVLEDRIAARSGATRQGHTPTRGSRLGSFLQGMTSTRKK